MTALALTLWLCAAVPVTPGTACWDQVGGEYADDRAGSRKCAAELARRRQADPRVRHGFCAGKIAGREGP